VLRSNVPAATAYALALVSLRAARARESAPVPSSSLRVVEAAEVPEWLITTGSLIAHDRADVVPNVPGKVLEVLVERGRAEIVKEGEVVA
jgi:multidrug efflux pump subunit AcrA (membrane-fusion protein)